jgi:competence protein ComEC
VNEDLRVQLFEKKSEVFIFLGIMMLLFAVNLFWQYKSYEALHHSKFFHTQATVINQYQKTSKRGKVYHVLKCKSIEGYSFITTNYEDIKALNGRDIRIGLITDRVSFIDFLKSFYAPSFEIELLAYHDSLKSHLQHAITTQHDTPMMKELFSALFLATPISKRLRERVSMLGISHLIAISGYHLSFLFGLIYLLLSKPYALLQDRYFPYRNRRFDLSVGIIMLLFWYVWLLDFTPSLIRSFVMMAFAFFLFHRNVRILSFEVLGVAVLFILAIKPTLLFSIGFWFSVSGIFYIYLFLHYFKGLNKWWIFIMINVWVYLAMIPIVHTIFPDFSFYQFLSPLLSMLFGIFYPLEMLLHLMGMGDLLDGLLEKLFMLQGEIYTLKTPLWYLALYIFASFLAIFHRRFLLFFAAVLAIFLLVV